jgi:hypothetical protein
LRSKKSSSRRLPYSVDDTPLALAGHDAEYIGSFSAVAQFDFWKL